MNSSTTEFGDIVNVGVDYHSPLDSDTGMQVPNLHFNYKMQPITTREAQCNSVMFQRPLKNISPL